MATIRERLGRFFLGSEIERMEASVRAIYSAYLEGPFETNPEKLIEQLQQFDPALLQDIITDMQYDVIGGMTTGYGVNQEEKRKRVVNESRRLFELDVIAQWEVGLWTDFGFGEAIKVVPKNRTAQKVFEEFWNTERNRSILADDELHHLSETVLVDGETFLVYYISTLDGAVTVRKINTSEITEIITHPDDEATPLFYKRVWITKDGQGRELYYPDYHAAMQGYLDREIVGGNGLIPLVEAVQVDPEKRADMVNPTTFVCVQHIAHKRKGGLRGWPLIAAGAPWIRAHKEFRQDRMAVAKAVAMFVNKLRMTGGGSRAIDVVRSRIQSGLSGSQLLDTNPPPVAGSTWIGNDKVDLERMPLTSGAGDAKTDGESLLLMAGLGGGVFPHWLGAGDAYRLATATAMEQPLLRQFSRYQKFWSAQFRKMATIVLWAAQKYGSKRITNMDVDVSTDRLVETDLPGITGAITQLIEKALTPYIHTGLIPFEVAQKILVQVWLIALQALGVNDAEDIASDEAFKVGQLVTPPVQQQNPDGGGDPNDPNDPDNNNDQRDNDNKDNQNGNRPRGRDAEMQDRYGEAITDQGTLKPKGTPVEPWGEGDTPITAEDVEAAVRQWNVRLPSQFWDLLRAAPNEEK